MMNRTNEEIVLVSEYDGCEACGRAPYVLHDGTTYLYQYRTYGPIVCSSQCDAECDCYAPNGPNIAMKSNDCPVHN